MRITFDFLARCSAQWPLLLKGVGVDARPDGHRHRHRHGASAWPAPGRARSGPAWLRWVVGTYVELIRNTPFIVQLFFIFFGLPAAGVKLSPEMASIIAMVINLGAYATEIIRAGIEATPRGQIEAAREPGAQPRAGVHARGAAAGAARRCGRRWSARSSS